MVKKVARIIDAMTNTKENVSLIESLVLPPTMLCLVLAVVFVAVVEVVFEAFVELIEVDAVIECFAELFKEAAVGRVAFDDTTKLVTLVGVSLLPLAFPYQSNP